MSPYKRISFKEGLEMFISWPLDKLQCIANTIRQQRYPLNEVSYVLDANPNYTNICKVDCIFCAFYRKPKYPDAYLLSFDDFRILLQRYIKLGIKTVLLQGGVHPSLGMDYFEELTRITIQEFPTIHPHFFSAVEINHAAQVSGMSNEQALQRLWDAGQRTIPGGGAECLSERVRKILSPKKMGPDGWINFHKLAHSLGFSSTATMMFGHVETPEDILIHLNTLRDAQDMHPGFYSFIPWSYKPAHTALGSRIQVQRTDEMYYRILAIARIFLDNFDHIAASWFSEGKSTGAQALHYGADDFGGIILDESVHKCAGWSIQSSKEEVCSLIRSQGFVPIERNTFYQHVSNTVCQL
ncbi:cyclic dehypoxanthinyl futalosine synthase [Candidatus Chlamydia sanziniae]|uniref:Menaquinone pathway protein n=1 Tax=Candidatus Chlamydia sanziniae TaxID=1806891 RepID=A0A1A9HUN5_9CHLA|nr:cyclic dehypoxanthinyl futalosine synthase [Candidatus Chlamydia sanziniae]ANH78710.1 Menaquinone pathway protein [Candidatus Chlamydia sanziniae]